MNIIKTAVSGLALGVGLSTIVFGQTEPVFSEDFGIIADGTAITTENTSFTYARASAGEGIVALEAVNPSSFGTGASGFLQAPTGSLTGVGIGDTLSASSVYTFSADFRFTDVTAGDVIIGLGSGSSFTADSTFASADGLFWLQSNNGNLERRTGVWAAVGEDISFANETNYSLHVVANGGAGSLTYGSKTLNAGSMDLYLNGVLVDDNVAVTNALAVDGFRVYSINGTGVEIDNVNLWNSAQAIPEPGTYAILLGVGALAVVVGRRRFSR